MASGSRVRAQLPANTDMPAPTSTAFGVNDVLMLTAGEATAPRGRGRLDCSNRTTGRLLARHRGNVAVSVCSSLTRASRIPEPAPPAGASHGALGAFWADTYVHVRSDSRLRSHARLVLLLPLSELDRQSDHRDKVRGMNRGPPMGHGTQESASSECNSGELGCGTCIAVAGVGPEDVRASYETETDRVDMIYDLVY